MDAFTVLIVLCVTLLAALHFYFKQKFNYWNAHGLKGPKPWWFVGNLVWLLSSNYKGEYENVRKYGKLYGMYFGINPMLVVGDPKMVQKIITTDFQYFSNRLQANTFHKIWDRTLFVVMDDTWKRIRSIISGAFIPGRKRNLSLVMQKNVEKLDIYFEKLCATGSDLLDTKKVATGFAIDLIASTSFGVENNSNIDSQSEDPLVSFGKKMVTIDYKSLLIFMCPKVVARLFGIETYVHNGALNYFTKFCEGMLRKRKQEQSSDRKDFLQLLIDARANPDEFDIYQKTDIYDDKIQISEKVSSDKQSLKKLSDYEVIANCIFLFVTGFEPTSIVISTCLFELAKNPNIQDRLYNDLHHALEKFEKYSDEYFDTLLNDIPYLEAVIKETLRFYPPFSRIFRMCSKDNYQLNDTVSLLKGQYVQISIASIHLNPEFYPDPTSYNPNRFMPENKHLLVPNAYIPFSSGPRNCLAVRFAFREIKLCLAHVLLKYKFSPNHNTPRELSFKKFTPLLTPVRFELKIFKR